MLKSLRHLKSPRHKLTQSHRDDAIRFLVLSGLADNSVASQQSPNPLIKMDVKRLGDSYIYPPEAYMIGLFKVQFHWLNLA